MITPENIKIDLTIYPKVVEALANIENILNKFQIKLEYVIISPSSEDKEDEPDEIHFCFFFNNTLISVVVYIPDGYSIVSGTFQGKLDTKEFNAFSDELSTILSSIKE